MRALKLTLILFVTALTLSAAPKLGLSLGQHADFNVLQVAFLPGGEPLQLVDGAAGSNEVEAFLADRPRQPTGFELKIAADDAQCSKLQDVSQTERPVGRSVLRFSGATEVHQFTVSKAELGSVRCASGSAFIELTGNQITYDGNVPK